MTEPIIRAGLDYPVRRFRPRAEAYFIKSVPFGEDVDTGSYIDNYFDSAIERRPMAGGGEVVTRHFVSAEDVLELSISRTTKNSAGTFTLKLSNKGNKYFIPDDPEGEIPALWEYDKAIASSRGLGTTSPPTIGSVPADSTESPIITVPTEEVPTPVANGVSYQFRTFEQWYDHPNYIYIETTVEGAEYRSAIYSDHEVVSDSLRRTLYYFNKQGDRVNLAENVPEVSYRIKEGDTLKSIAQVELDDPQFWFLVMTYSDNEVTFGDQTGPDTDLASYVGVTIKLPKITQGLSNNAKIIAIPNRMLYELWGGLPAENWGRPPQIKGQCIFSPMDRVILFLSGRFAPRDKPMLRSFTGLVDRAAPGESGESQTVTISGSDTTKWLSLAQYNINPALFPIEQYPKLNALLSIPQNRLKIFTTVFAGKSGAQIVEEAVLGSPNALWEGTDIGPNITEEEARKILNRMTAAGPFKRKKNIDGFPIDTPPFGPQLRYISEYNGYIVTEDLEKEIIAPYYLWVQNPSGEQYKDIANQLVSLSPYKKYWNNSWQTFQSEYQDRRKICFDTAQLTNFLFYADQNGDLHYCQPRYDLHHILGSSRPEIFVIDDLSIISNDTSESDDDIITRIYVTSDTDYMQLDDQTKFAANLYGIYEDPGLTRLFGQRFQVFNEPMIGNAGTDLGGSKADYYFYGKSVVQRIAQNRFQGSVTITGRPELMPGFPVWIPRKNRVYFVESVDHNYKQGGQFTTTMRLTYGRKPWERLDELLTYRATGIYANEAAKESAMAAASPEEVLFEASVTPQSVLSGLFMDDIRKSIGLMVVSKLFDKIGLSSRGITFQGSFVSIKPVCKSSLMKIQRVSSDGETTYVITTSAGRMSSVLPLKGEDLPLESDPRHTTSSQSISSLPAPYAGALPDGNIVVVEYTIRSDDDSTREYLQSTFGSNGQVNFTGEVPNRSFLVKDVPTVVYPVFRVMSGGNDITSTIFAYLKKSGIPTE